MEGMRLNHLVAVGRGKRPARLDFRPGLNVIYGAANTGKTHVLQLVDYALGASNEKEAPPEQLGYEAVLLGVELLNGEQFTLCRLLKLGGDIQRVDGFHYDLPDKSEGEFLGANHRDKSSLSKFLLQKLGMEGAKLRKNAKGETRDLSFRDLAHLVVVPEGKIQSEGSPIETGQYVTKTAEYSLFKYLLTGLDDSLLAAPDKQRPDKVKLAAKLELLDAQIAEAEASVKTHSDEREDLGEQEVRLEKSMSDALLAWDEASGDYRHLSSRRREVSRRRDVLAERGDDIDLLIDRFDILDKQYVSDIERLVAIEQASSLIDALDPGPCPWCGAAAEHRGFYSDAICEGDFQSIRQAAEAEHKKITAKRSDLELTVQQLRAELKSIDAALPDFDAEIAGLSRDIQMELPDLQGAKSRMNEIMLVRTQTQSTLAKFHHLDRLKETRGDLVSDSSVDSVSLMAEGVIDGTLLDQFAEDIQQLLTQWSFPAQRVSFDISRRDIQVSGKPRRVNGKGVRAVLHSAFSISLMRFTSERNQKHARFLMLDSPLVTYRDPISDDEKSLSTSDLSERFYEPFRNWDPRLQVVIIENRDPPSWLGEIANVVAFSGSDQSGRKGFYLA